MRTRLVFAVLALLFLVARASSDNKPGQAGQTRQQPVSTYLTADICTSPIGGNVSSMLREKIRGSSGYILADTPRSPGQALGPEIMLMCTDVPDEPVTSVSFVISFRVGTTRDIGDAGVDVVGRAKAAEEAQEIFSKFDNWWTQFSATHDYYKKQ